MITLILTYPPPLPGEMYSVSPFMAARLSPLFVLNERVVLLGRWKHGFFSMIPVAATNVGQICLNFQPVLELLLLSKNELQKKNSHLNLISLSLTHRT